MNTSKFCNTALLLLLMCFAGCQNRNKCQDGGAIRLDFRGFDSAALEKVVIKKYSRGDGFVHAMDSSVYLLSQSDDAIREYETAHHYITWPYSGVANLYYTNDYSVQIEATGKEYRISEIAITDETTTCAFGSGSSSCLCYEDVSSLIIDGTIIYTGRQAAKGSPPAAAYALEIQR